MLAMLGFACAWLRSRFAPLTQNPDRLRDGISEQAPKGKALRRIPVPTTKSHGFKKRLAEGNEYPTLRALHRKDFSWTESNGN